MVNSIWTSKKRMLRPARRCKAGCILVRVAPALEQGR